LQEWRKFSQQDNVKNNDSDECIEMQTNSDGRKSVFSRFSDNSESQLMQQVCFGFWVPLRSQNIQESRMQLIICMWCKHHQMD